MKTLLKKISLLFAAAFLLVIPNAIHAQDGFKATPQPTLVRAVMCEAIEKFTPVNQAVVFSIERGSLMSFSEFYPVPEQTVIYHKWYNRGVLISAKQLTIYPPRWSSFSSMQLRETDKGPWQVDITDQNGRIFKTLRFSITD
jgi:hypothetical protein